MVRQDKFLGPKGSSFLVQNYIFYRGADFEKGHIDIIQPFEEAVFVNLPRYWNQADNIDTEIGRIWEPTKSFP